jgi:hypothetical protein
MATRITGFQLSAHKILQVLLAACLASVLLLGCAGGQSPTGRMSGVLPAGSDAADAPGIFVIRTDISNYMYMMINAPSHKIVVDGLDVFMLAPWVYTNFPIATGEHRIGIKCFGGWSDSWKEDSLTLLFEANKKYYFKTSQSWQCASISQIEETEGLALIKESHHVPFDREPPMNPDMYGNKPRWNIWTGGGL